MNRIYRRARLRDALVYWLYLPAAVLGGGKAVDLLLALPPLPAGRWLRAAALLPGLAGVLLIFRADRELRRRGEGTANPRFPPRRLVTEGVYGWCRHPMFLGYDLAALAAVLACASAGMLLLSYPLFIVFQFRFLQKEETILMRRFGADYEAYRRRVPLLLPGPFRGERP